MTRLDLEKQIALVEDALMSSYSFLNDFASKGDPDKCHQYIQLITSLTHQLNFLKGVDFPPQKAYAEDYSPGYSVGGLSSLKSRVSSQLAGSAISTAGPSSGNTKATGKAGTSKGKAR